MQDKKENMLCPFLFKVAQHSMRYTLLNEDKEYRGEFNIFVENQSFEKCSKESCVAWSKEKNICRKLEN